MMLSIFFFLHSLLPLFLTSHSYQKYQEQVCRMQEEGGKNSYPTFTISGPQSMLKISEQQFAHRDKNQLWGETAMVAGWRLDLRQQSYKALK